MSKPVRYRDYILWCDPPPIPIRCMDYHYAHDDYDGAPNEPGGPPADNRCGSATSIEACREAIDELECCDTCGDDIKATCVYTPSQGDQYLCEECTETLLTNDVYHHCCKCERHVPDIFFPDFVDERKKDTCKECLEEIYGPAWHKEVYTEPSDLPGFQHTRL
jgi:hypothetical protein